MIQIAFLWSFLFLSLNPVTPWSLSRGIGRKYFLLFLRRAVVCGRLTASQDDLELWIFLPRLLPVLFPLSDLGKHFKPEWAQVSLSSPQCETRNCATAESEPRCLPLTACLKHGSVVQACLRTFSRVPGETESPFHTHRSLSTFCLSTWG